MYHPSAGQSRVLRLVADWAGLDPSWALVQDPSAAAEHRRVEALQRWLVSEYASAWVALAGRNEEAAGLRALRRGRHDPSAWLPVLRAAVRAVFPPPGVKVPAWIVAAVRDSVPPDGAWRDSHMGLSIDLALSVAMGAAGTAAEQMRQSSVEVVQRLAEIAPLLAPEEGSTARITTPEEVVLNLASALRTKLIESLKELR